MNLIERLIGEKITRRNFLSWLAKAAAVSALYPVAGCSSSTKTKSQKDWTPVAPQNWQPSERTPAVAVEGRTTSRLLLKNGLIVDGSGKCAFYGDVLITFFNTPSACGGVDKRKRGLGGNNVSPQV